MSAPAQPPPVWVAISHGPDGAFSLGVFATRAGAVQAATDEGQELGIDTSQLAATEGDATALGDTYSVSVQCETLGLRP